MPSTQISRARGCLLGQLAGDSLGSLVEFSSAEEIGGLYPGGVRKLADGGYWNTIAGQPTDDSEMALALARSLVDLGRYDAKAVKVAYVDWLASDPFDVGNTVRGGLIGEHKPDSQANGALMRISPLGIFGVNYTVSEVAEWARRDADITHIHKICAQCNDLFATAIAYSIKSGCNGGELYESIKKRAETIDAEPQLLDIIARAATQKPSDYMKTRGWVLIAFQNALWQLLHAPNFEEGVVDTVMRGGDTDTNAAICGALLGSVYGEGAIPEQWKKCLKNCRPSHDNLKAENPRSECYWPCDAVELAEKLLGV